MSSARKRRRRAWRVAVVGVAAVVLVAIGHTVWMVSARRRLAATLAELRGQGEPTTPAELRPAGDPPDSANASLDYERAEASLHVGSVAWGRFGDYRVGSVAPPLRADEKADAAAVCHDESAALTLVTAARGKRAGAWHEPVGATPAVMAEFVGAVAGPTGLVPLLAIDACRQADAGDAASALARLCDGLAVADAAERRPSLDRTLRALGMTVTACRAIDAIVPALPVNGGDRPALAALLATLVDERPLRAGVRLGFEAERLADTKLLQDVTVGRRNPRWGYPEAMPRSLALLYLLRPMLLADTAMTAQHLAGVTGAAAAADLQLGRARMPTTLPAAVDDHPFLHPGAALFIPPFDRDVRLAFRALAARRLAAVAVAGRLSLIDHPGRVPKSWPDLVPAYLPAVPVDPVDGNPLRLVDGPPRAYSIGDDERDDGGVPVDESAPLRQRHGDDVAFFVAPPRLPSPR